MEKPLFIFKICLLGFGGVGKTCIARRFCWNRFDQNTKLTIGIDFYTYHLPMVVNGEEGFANLLIWDFGGQTQFQRLFPYYIKGANGVFMTFSLINLQTLLKLDWYYEALFRYESPEIPRILVGTKHDLIRETDEQSVVDDLIIQQFMKTNNEDTFYQTSSKDDYNIKTIFREMTKKILKDRDLEYDRIIEDD